jgi:uncharacterized Zn-binding protein involved in type VI secretion
MPFPIVVVGDTCIGTDTLGGPILSGKVTTGSPSSKSLTYPIARVTDQCIINGISKVPPGSVSGVGSIISAIPVAFILGVPVEWNYTEIGIIVQSQVAAKDFTLSIAHTGSLWTSPHFFGTLVSTLTPSNLVA